MPNIDDEPSGIGYLKNLKQEPTGGYLKHAKDFELLQNKPLAFEKIAESIEKTKEEFRRRNPSFPAMEVDLYFHMIFGVLALSPEILVSDRLMRAEKTESARAQQMMVHKLIWGIYGDNDEKIRERIYHQWRNLELMSQTQMGRNVRLPVMLSGIRNQASIIQALMDEDFQVVLPSYQTQSNGYSEVGDWDVGRGIDFLAIPPEADKLFLLNAKGTVSNQNVEVKDQTRGDLASILPRNILSHMPSKDAPVFRAEIWIPSSSTHKVTTDLPESSANYRYALSGAILLKGLDYADIIDRLKELS